MAALLLLLALAGPASGTRAATPPPAAPVAVDSLGKLLDDLARWSRRPAERDGERLEEADRLLRELDRAWPRGSSGQGRAVQGMLDFLGRCQRIERGRPPLAPPEPPSPALVTEEDLRARALAMLRRRLPDLERELTHGVLTGRDGDGPHPLDRRTAACEVLAASPTGTATLALLTATRPAHPEPEVPPELLDEAASALSGRESEGVHLRLIHLLERCESEPGLMHKSILENHFRSIQLGRDEGRAIQAVLGLVGPSLRSADWRRASRGVSVSRCLPNGPALPLLIEALEDWLAREDDPDRPVRRVQGELVAELERRSGRRYGPHPDRWRALLEAWQRGGTGLAGEPGQPVPSTVGGFFGLRPSTDRVTFVLDCSGSMEARFRSASGRTRLEEAAEQMRALVEQLGPRTRFNVVVFADEARRWRETLARVDEAALRAATRFVLRTGAGGGTRLQEGIRVALHADRTGHLDLRALESDTVIVLCDGGTAEGPGWVEPFLREVNDEARVVFHAVQLGQGGDGTLEALSEGSRGELLRIDG